MKETEQIFLHGICGIFALALVDRFGYSIGILLENDDADAESVLSAPWAHLVHCFCCAAQPNGQLAYIDVRGVLLEKENLLEEFEDFFNESILVPNASTELIRQSMVADMGEVAFLQYYKTAQELIGCSKERYQVRTAISKEGTDTSSIRASSMLPS